MNTARAVCDFEAAEERELSFKEGDVLRILGMPPGDWWQAEHGGHLGWIPKTHVELMTDPALAKAPTVTFAVQEDDDADADAGEGGDDSAQHPSEQFESAQPVCRWLCGNWTSVDGGAWRCRRGKHWSLHGRACCTPSKRSPIRRSCRWRWATRCICSNTHRKRVRRVRFVNLAAH